MSCEIELVGPEVTACSQGSPFLPPVITGDMFSLELPNGRSGGSNASNPISVTMDNTLSPSHTLVQIHCQDHKGLIYDIMRTLKDYNIQVNYKQISGRISYHLCSLCLCEVIFICGTTRKELCWNLC